MFSTPSSLVIPHDVSAKVSIRTVPDQDDAVLLAAVEEHVQRTLRDGAPASNENRASVETLSRGNWWLADPNSACYRAAAAAIETAWGVPPQYVREGGSLPLASYLAHELDAPVVVLPLGQQSDRAHLTNERMRLLNLHRGRDVFKAFLANLGAQV